jgi:hypothetical protein
MEKGKLFYRSAKTVGVLLMIATLLHSTLGTAELLTAIKVGSLMPSMENLFKNVWIFSCIMLFLSGVWVLFLARDLGQLQRRAWWQAVFIGLGYLGGSVTAMWWSGIQAHLLAFAFVSLLFLVPLVRWAGAFKSSP